MHIRPDELQRIAIDRFTSTSGLWESVLAERFEPHQGTLKGYYLLILYAGTGRVRKVFRLAVDSPAIAYLKWEQWREKFAGPSNYNFEDEIPNVLAEYRFVSPPWIMTEDDAVLRMEPRGSRMFVRDLTPVDEVTARMRALGLHTVVDDKNKPAPSMGIVIKLSNDPMWKLEGYAEGDFVMFSRYAGNTFSESGQQYRSLEPHEIIGTRQAKDGIEDLVPPHPFGSQLCEHCGQAADAAVHVDISGVKGK